VKPPCLGEGECGPCPDFASCTLAFALQLKKITENPNAIRLVDLAVSGNCLDWPAGPCRPWLSRQTTGSTLGQRICRLAILGDSPSANFESKLCGRQTAEHPDPCVSACYLCSPYRYIHREQTFCLRVIREI
jgi:hypothetical protein